MCSGVRAALELPQAAREAAGRAARAAYLAEKADFQVRLKRLVVHIARWRGRHS